jgi:hypothetical protein
MPSSGSAKNRVIAFSVMPSSVTPLIPYLALFELGRQARPGRQTGIRLYRPVQAEEQNKSRGHRLTAKAITYRERHLNNK